MNGGWSVHLRVTNLWYPSVRSGVFRSVNETARGYWSFAKACAAEASRRRSRHFRRFGRCDDARSGLCRKRDHRGPRNYGKTPGQRANKHNDGNTNNTPLLRASVSPAGRRKIGFGSIEHVPPYGRDTTARLTAGDFPRYTPNMEFVYSTGRGEHRTDALNYYYWSTTSANAFRVGANA